MSTHLAASSTVGVKEGGELENDARLYLVRRFSVVHFQSPLVSSPLKKHPVCTLASEQHITSTIYVDRRWWADRATPERVR